MKHSSNFDCFAGTKNFVKFFWLPSAKDQQDGLRPISNIVVSKLIQGLSQQSTSQKIDYRLNILETIGACCYIDQ